MMFSISSRSHVWTVAVLVGLLSLILPATGYPTGAPTSVCTSLIPGHGSQSNAASPYTIVLNSTMYGVDGTITVTVRGNAFAGIIMQMRGVGTTTILGTWTMIGPNTKIMNCNKTSDSVTHSNTNSKQNAVFKWKAPTNLNTGVEVVATIAQSKALWWKDVKSDRFDATVTTARPDTTTKAKATAMTSDMFLLVAAMAVTVAKLNL